MRKLKLVVVSILFCFSKMEAQQASVTSGGNATGATGSVSYSIGQVAYSNAIGTTGSVNQGVQQPFEIVTLGNDNFPEISLQMTVYPNPTNAFINLEIGDYSLDNLQYQLVDTNGKQIASQKIASKETAIDMQNLSSAIYLLTVMDNNKVLKTFKIIKNN
jgi:hypothetical protein